MVCRNDCQTALRKSNPCVLSTNASTTPAPASSIAEVIARPMISAVVPRAMKLSNEYRRRSPQPARRCLTIVQSTDAPLARGEGRGQERERPMDGVAAVSWGSDRIDLFWRGDDRALWHRSWHAGA